jgi:hypothetical protein
MIIVGAIVKFLVARKVSTGWAHFLAWAAVIIAALLLIWAGWSLLKSTIITQHDAGQAAQQAQQQLNRQEDADLDQANRDEKRQLDDIKITEVTRNAIAANPTEAAKPVGPGTNAALDELRRRQEARTQRR